MASIADEQFVRLVSDHQRGLYAYILQLIPNRVDAGDILGETNLVLWRKRKDFQFGTSFGAWASRVAYYEVLAFRSRKGRERLCFDNDLVMQLAEEGAETAEQADPMRLLLLDCMEKLPEADRQLLEQRYHDDMTPRAIGAGANRTARAIAQALYRIRTTLMRCMQSGEESAV